MFKKFLLICLSVFIIFLYLNSAILFSLEFYRNINTYALAILFYYSDFMFLFKPFYLYNNYIIIAIYLIISLIILKNTIIKNRKNSNAPLVLSALFLGTFIFINYSWLDIFIIFQYIYHLLLICKMIFLKFFRR
jgi:hypothetical protein